MTRIDASERRSMVEAVDRLIDEQRSRCFWYLRSDWYPRDDRARVRALRRIEERGDVETVARSATLRRWFSPSSSAGSVDS